MSNLKSTMFIGLFLTINFLSKASDTAIHATLMPEPKALIEKFVPVTISQGFDQDLIAESKPAKEHTSTRMDDASWVYYSTDVQVLGGLPADGVIEIGNTKYQIAPYSGNNALRIDNGQMMEKELIFEKPIMTKSLKMLATSANGISSFRATVCYTDGSSSQVSGLNIDDWFGDTGAVTGLGRIFRSWQESFNGNMDDDIDNPNFRLSEVLIEADPSKEVSSLKLRPTNFSGFLIPFAISACQMIDDSDNPLSIQQINNQQIFINTPKSLQIPYSLGIAPKEPNFSVRVAAENPEIVSITEISNNDSDISFNLSGNTEGKTIVTVTLTNGKYSISSTFEVSVTYSEMKFLNVKDQTIKVGEEPTELKIHFSLAGAEQADDFSVLAIADNECVAISEEFINGTEFSFFLTAMEAGSSIVTLYLNNNQEMIQKSFSVTVLPKDPVISITTINKQFLEVGKSTEVETTFDLDGMVVAEDFKAMVYTFSSSSSKLVSISNVSVDHSANKLMFTLTGLQEGNGTVDILIKNGSRQKSSFFAINVSQPTSIESTMDNIPTIYPSILQKGDLLKVKTDNLDLIQLVNMSGYVLKSITPSNEIELVSIDNLSTGAYFIITYSKSERKITRITIQ